MIDYDILKKFGTTQNRLRQIATADRSTEDGTQRDKLEKEIESEVIEGVHFNLRNHHIFTSADLAWDGNIITGEVLPLVMFAQGRIDHKKALQWCKDCGMGEEKLKEYFDHETKRVGAQDIIEFKDMKVSKFVEVQINMVRSYVQRRQAAQFSKYASQYPFLKYETYDRSYEAQLLSDIMSQRAEIMANQFGYRHGLKQTTLNFLLYPHTVEFAEEAWRTEKQYRKNKDEEGNWIGEEVREVITREGVPTCQPHPSRVFYDISSPLSSINSDTGCGYIGFWEIAKYDDIRGNTKFWNRDSIEYTPTFADLFANYNPYVSVYFPCQLDWPKFSNTGDVTQINDRESNVGIYSTDHGKSPLVLTQIYKKIVPKDYGIGEYPYPVWVRFVVASARTIVYAEIMPSTPAFYYGVNEKDDRLYNISFAHEVMPFQDQMTNMMSQMVLSMKQNLLKIIALNIGILGPEHIKEVRKKFLGQEWLDHPIVVEYDFDKRTQMGLGDRNIMHMEQAQMTQDIEQLMRAMIEMNVFAERIMNLSPQEQGQPAPRVSSATEIVEIANTVSTLYNFISKALDEGLAAKKRYIYEAVVSLQKGDIHLSVMNMYPDHVIENAGFTVEKFAKANGDMLAQKVTGRPDRLIYDYVFNSREGGDRTSNIKTAEVLVQLLPQVLQIPGVIDRMGTDKLYELVNAIMRNSGAGIEFKLNALEDNEMAGDQQQEEVNQQTILQALDRISNILGELAQENAEQSEEIEELKAVADSLLGGAQRRERGQRLPGGPVEDVPTQGTPATPPNLPIAEIQPGGEADPFEPRAGTAQQLPNPEQRII